PRQQRAQVPDAAARRTGQLDLGDGAGLARRRAHGSREALPLPPARATRRRPATGRRFWDAVWGYNAVVALDGDLFGGLLELAGSGGGTAGRVRRWSAVVLAMSGLLGLVGVYMMISSASLALDVASIEDGLGGQAVLMERSGRSSTQVTGHLLQADAITFNW